MPRTPKKRPLSRPEKGRGRVPTHYLRDLVIAPDGTVYAGTSDGRVHRLEGDHWTTIDAPVPGTRHDKRRTPHSFPNTLERAHVLADDLAEGLLEAIHELAGTSGEETARARAIRAYNRHARELARPAVPENLEQELEAEA